MAFSKEFWLALILILVYLKGKLDNDSASLCSPCGPLFDGILQGRPE